MSDYKYELQKIAEAFAEQRYGKDFYDLTENQRYLMFSEAEMTWCEQKADQAGQMNDKIQEGYTL
jgi:hypothetical protein